MQIEVLQSEMYRVAVRFRYKKLDGSIRTALGLIPSTHRTTAGLGQDGIFRYWDVGRGGWRSFYADRFIEILPVTASAMVAPPKEPK